MSSKKGLLPEGTKWYGVRWEKETVLEKNGKKLLWDWEHRMRTNCTARRPDLALEDTENKVVIVIDTACPNEMNKEEKEQKNQKISIAMLRNTRTKRRLYCENDTISDWVFRKWNEATEKRFERTV